MISSFFHLFFYNPIYNALVAFVALAPGYDVGIAVILLTISIRLVLLPFSLSAARTQMLRISNEGKEGVAFGLYTMTGRAATFLAPALFALFIDVFDSDRAGMGGLCVVLVLGLVLMLGVRTPAHRPTGLADRAADRQP